MARRGLWFLDELDAVKEQEKLEQEQREREESVVSGPIITDAFDLAAVLGLHDHDPDPSF